MTVLLGPTPCHGCGVPVTVVRRPVVIAGHGAECPRKVRHDACAWVESAALREVAAIDATGGRHHCIGLAIAHPFDYAAMDGSSVTDSDTMCDGRATARSSGAAVPRLGRI